MERIGVDFVRMEVIHTAIWISDLEETKAFYINALGLSHTRDFEGGDGALNYYVAGDEGAEIQFKYDPDQVDTVNPSGFAHIAVTVDDTEATVDRMVEETGCTVVSGPLEMDSGVVIAFIEDPDGYQVELVGRA